MLSASVSCADPSWGPGLHRDELRQTGRSPAPAIGHEPTFVKGCFTVAPCTLEPSYTAVTVRDALHRSVADVLGPAVSR